MKSRRLPPLEDVLDAFAVENAADQQALTKYLGQYPEYAEELVDLSREIHRTSYPDQTDLSARDKIRIELAWQRFSEMTSVGVPDPFASLSVSELREIAATLGVKRQVLAALSEHRVILASVPAKFLSRLATAVNIRVEQLRHVLSVPVDLSPVRSFKSDASPEAGGAVTFEKLLIDAGHSEAERSALMLEEE